MSNKFLFLILAGLLGFAYWLQEGSLNRELEGQREVQLVKFSTDDIQEIKLSTIDLKRKGQTFLDKKSGWALSDKVLHLFFTTLESLQAIRKIDLNQEGVSREDFIPDSNVYLEFVLKGEKFRFTLGKKVAVDTTFYMAVSNGTTEDIFQVKDLSLDSYVYNKENSHNHDQHYQRIKTLFSIPYQAFLDKRLYPATEIKSVAYDSQRNRAFTVDFDQVSTKPEPLKGLSYSKELFKTHVQDLLGTEALSLHFEWEEKDLENKVSTLRIDGKTQLELYRKWRGKLGFYVSKSETGPLFELYAKDARVFFLNVQDFWDKRALPESHPVNIGPQNFKVKFNGANELAMRLPSTQNFEIETADKEAPVPNFEKWKGLFNLLSGVGQYKQADRVASLPSHLLAQTQNMPSIELDFQKKKYKLIKKGQELLVVNLSDNFVLHYLVGDHLPFNLSLKDFFHIE